MIKCIDPRTGSELGYNREPAGQAHSSSSPSGRIRRTTLRSGQIIAADRKSRSSDFLRGKPEVESSNLPWRIPYRPYGYWTYRSRKISRARRRERVDHDPSPQAPEVSPVSQERASSKGASDYAMLPQALHQSSADERSCTAEPCRSRIVVNHRIS